MSTLKVDAIRHNSATSDAITTHSDGTASAKIIDVGGGQLSHRNLVINGAMMLAQRGTSSTSSGYQTVDRFQTIVSGVDEAITQAQVDITAGTTPYTLGFRKAYKITNGNQTSGLGAADRLETIHNIEAQDIANSGWNYLSTSSYITLQFWIKSSVAQNFYGRLLTSSGTDYNYPFETGSLSANTWTKITKTIPGNSGITVDNTTGHGLRISLYLGLGTDYTGSVSLNTWAAYNSAARVPDITSTWYTTNDATLEITGVQLEVGNTATSFEHRTFGDELLRCQRYCMKWWNNGDTTSNHSRFPPGYYQNTTSGVFFLFHSVPMRQTDGRTLTHNVGVIENMSGGGNGNNLSIMADGGSSMITPIILSGMSGVTQHAIFVPRIGSGQTNWYIIVSSEL